MRSRERLVLQHIACEPPGVFEDGEWKPGLREARRVPYNLAAVIEASAQGHVVYVVEGEKDADNLRAAGFAAT